MDKYGALLSNFVVSRKPCPRCRASGKDRSGDNLVVYSNGHSHCFACNFHIKPDIWEQMAAIAAPSKVSEHSPTELVLPRDNTPIGGSIFSKEPQRWLRNYGITDSEMLKNKMGWCHTTQLLTFPVYDDNGKLLMWQGRNFGNVSTPKYLTEGPKSDIMHLVGKDSNVLIVTEDLVSAIKVGRCYQATPLWGSSMAHSLILRAADEFSTLGIWLDKDKTKEAVKIALRASQYIPSFVVSSELDPKAYGDSTIREFIEFASHTLLDKDRLTKDVPPEPIVPPGEITHNDPFVPTFDPEDIAAAKRLGAQVAAQQRALFRDTRDVDLKIYCPGCTLSGTRDELDHLSDFCKLHICHWKDGTPPYRKDSGGS